MEKNNIMNVKIERIPSLSGLGTSTLIMAELLVFFIFHIFYIFFFVFLDIF